MTPQPAAGIRPQTLMLTFLGNAVLGRNIAVFSGGYVAVMDRLGVSEHATRSTLTRMVHRGLLARHRRGRKMYFGLTPRAEAVLSEGEHRLWHTGAVNRDGEERWTLLGFSVPETRRDDRHLLRSRLRWTGFGLLRSGLWIAPPVLIRGDHDSLWRGQPQLRQRWPPTTTLYRSPVHGSTLPGHSAGVTVSPLRFTRSAAHRRAATIASGHQRRPLERIDAPRFTLMPMIVRPIARQCADWIRSLSEGVQ